MTPETLTQIKKNISDAEIKLKEMKEDINKARKAGIDVTENEKSYNDLSKKVGLLKSAYL